MKRINIKCFLPYNWYHARSIQLYKDGVRFVKTSHASEQSIEIDEDIKEIALKLDYYSSKTSISSTQQETYLIIYWDISNSPLKAFIQALNPKSIKIKEVSKKEYELFSPSYYHENKENEQILHRIDWLSISLSFIIALLFIFNAKVDSFSIESPSIIMGVLQLVILSILLYDRNKIKLSQYKFRMIIFGVFSAVIAPVIVNTWNMKFLIILLGLLVTFRAIAIQGKSILTNNQ
jgi:hypothetical protein